MQFNVGFELIYQFPQPTPVIMVVDVHYSRAADIISQQHLTTSPPVPLAAYRDTFGNWCTRLVAPPGRVQITYSAVVKDSGLADVLSPGAMERTVQALPEDSLVFLLGSRYCETDLLSQTAWNLFGHLAPGWSRVQAICDYVHNHIRFDYQQARATRTAVEGFREQVGVCRDYTHLAITFCRCLNIPARYCTGYLGDVGTLPPYGVGDFAAWMEVNLDGEWHTFDPRNNVPRIGRVLIGRGRDASDVAIATTFGPNTLESFRVWTDELSEA
ncbi:MAG: transglutaminase family protein [Acidobacteriota bacterium]